MNSSPTTTTLFSNKIHVFYKNTCKSTFLSLYRNFSISLLTLQYICTHHVPLSHQLLLSTEVFARENFKMPNSAVTCYLNWEC